MSANTIAELTRVGVEMYERIELCAVCDIESIDLTVTLTQANKIITNTLTYVLFRPFFQPLLHLEGPPSELRAVTFHFPFGAVRNRGSL
jgi:hypothetical protein